MRIRRTFSQELKKETGHLVLHSRRLLKSLGFNNVTMSG